MALKRRILDSINLQLKKYPVVVLTGPRQSGKTTLLRNGLSSYRYINLEDPDNNEYASRDPRGFLNEYNDKVIIDEAQKVPSLFSYIQSIVDDSGKMGQFVLSGSQNFNLMEHISQSLAGRVALFTLLPYDFDEMKNGRIWTGDLTSMLTKGAYPAIYDRKIEPDQYYKDYLATYIKRDITQLTNIQNMTTFSRFIKLCAARAGQLLNYSDLARDTGVSHSTANNWLSLLEASFVLFLLPPFYKNYNKRLTKSPKLYFYDTGLLCYLLNIRKGNLVATNRNYGHIFENFIIAEKYKRALHSNLPVDYYYWRDNHGNEIDLLYEDADSTHIYEIKSSKTISYDMFKGMDFFKKLAKDEVGNQTLIYGGDKDQKRTEYAVKTWKGI